jgi:hypothetical protein
VSFVAAPVLNFLVELDMVDIDGRVCDGNVFVIPNWFRFWAPVRMWITHWLRGGHVVNVKNNSQVM